MKTYCPNRRSALPDEMSGAPATLVDSFIPTRDASSN
jgi:hypothetical protein